MSLDNLLTLVFILFFVVGPLLRRFSGQQRKPPMGRPSAPPARPDATRAGEAAGQAEGPLARRLEEARRRVLEALGEEEPRTEQVPTPARTPADVRTLDWQASPRYVPAFIKGQEVRVRTGRKAAPATPDTVSEQLPSVRRRSTASAARLRSGMLPELDKIGIINGIIWHEILSEPVSRRGIRRLSSRHRSP
jgi:hypothetical protein